MNGSSGSRASLQIIAVRGQLGEVAAEVAAGVPGTPALRRTKSTTCSTAQVHPRSPLEARFQLPMESFLNQLTLDHARQRRGGQTYIAMK